MVVSTSRNMEILCLLRKRLLVRKVLTIIVIILPSTVMCFTVVRFAMLFIQAEDFCYHFFLFFLLNLNYFLFRLRTGICLGNLRENITFLPAASFFFFLFVTVSDHISRKPRCRFSAILPCSWRRNVAVYIEWLQKPLTTMLPVTETQSSTRPQPLLNVLRRERILKADSSDVLAKFSRKISSLLARNSFVNTYHFLSKVLFII